jgi:hypothetical protein
MKDFSNACFPPHTKFMTQAHVQLIAETVLRTAKDGERDPKVLERMAALELQISF